MTRRANVYIVALLCASAGYLCLPALGQASSGGGGLAPGGSGSAPQPQAAPGDAPVSASADGITIATKESAFLRGGLSFSGNVPQSEAGDQIEIQRSGRETGWTWETTATSQVQSDGTFAAVWKVNHIGRFAIRAVLAQDSGSGAPSSGSGGSSGEGASTSADWPTVTVTVYRPSVATLFGPGFYGKRTACGETLHRNTIGVANRTLPCGTLVSIYYRGRTLTVPVIDRGPYANGADWDLTMATGRALGIDETVTLGAVSLPQSNGSAAAKAR